jgi:hypothetical protein
MVIASSTTTRFIMHVFDITTSSHIMLTVFATSYDKAAGIFMIWHAEHREAPLPDFEVARRNPGCPALDGEHLQDALARETSGVASYDPNTGWLIVSPTDQGEG